GHADAEGVDAHDASSARGQHAANSAEVGEGGGVGLEVAEGVDEVEGEGDAGSCGHGGSGVEALHIGGEEGGAAGEAEARDARAGVVDHRLALVEADDAPAAAGGDAEVAARAAGGLEPGAGADAAVGEESLLHALQ